MPINKKRLTTDGLRLLNELAPKARRLGISRGTLRYRIVNGWSFNSLLAPKQRSGNPNAGSPHRKTKPKAVPVENFNHWLNKL